MRRIRRGARALLALAVAAPVLAVAMGAEPAHAAVTGGEFSIEGKGAFSTSNGGLEIAQPTNALNSAPGRTDLDWVLVPFKIFDGRAIPDGNFVVSAPEGTSLQTGVWYENAVGFRLRPGAPGMRFDECETERGRFIVDALQQGGAPNFTITKLVVRFESHCNGTVIGSVAWNGDNGTYKAHRAGQDAVNGVVDFGTAGGTKTVRITNTGDALLNVNPGGGAVAKVEGTGAEDFVIGTGCNGANLSAGQSCNITVTANPRADGPSDAVLRVFSQFTGTDPTKPIGGGEAIHLKLVGQNTGRGRVDLDGEAGNPVVNGARKAKSGAFSLTGSTATLSDPGQSVTITSGGGLPAGAVYAVPSQATMGLTIDSVVCGSPTGQVHIVENTGGSFVARFRLTCTGGSDRAVLGQISFAPQSPLVTRSVEPTVAHVFDTAVPVGQGSLPKPITVTNDGRGPTTVAARITGDVAQFSVILNTCKNVVLQPGKSCTVLVAFTPTRPGGGVAAIAIRDTYSDQLDRRVFLQGLLGVDAPGYVWQVDGEFVPLPPTRILDTRIDPSFRTVPEPVHGGEPRFFDVRGKGGVPTDGASAVVLNVTVDSPDSAAYLTVYPTPSGDAPPPTASNLNFVKGQTVPNLVVVPLGDGGRVSLYTNTGNVEAIVDVVGWITGLTSTERGSRLEPLAPTRILDTRTGTGGRSTPLGGNESMRLQIADPADGYTAAVINLTGTDTTAATYVTAYPTGLASRPTASNLNLVRNQTRPNLVMVQIGPDGAIELYNFAGQVNLVADLVGLYKPGGFRDAQTGRIKPINPTRVIYTPGSGDLLAGGTTKTWDIGAQSAAVGLANMATGQNLGFIGNFTATEGTASTYMTAYPSDQPRPTASNLNVLPNENVPNLSVVSLSATNTFDVFNNAGNIHYIFDVVARVAA